MTGIAATFGKQKIPGESEADLDSRVFKEAKLCVGNTKNKRGTGIRHNYFNIPSSGGAFGVIYFEDEVQDESNQIKWFCYLVL